MHFLEATQFLNAQVLAGHKVNFTLRPGFTLQTWFSSKTPHPPNYSCLMRGKDITRAIGRVGP